MFKPVAAPVNPSVSEAGPGNDGTLRIPSHILSRNHCTFSPAQETDLGIHFTELVIFQSHSKKLDPFCLIFYEPVVTYCVALLEPRRPVLQPTMGGF